MATAVQLKYRGRVCPFYGRLVWVLLSVFWFSGCVSVPVDQPDDPRLSAWERKEEQAGQPIETPIATRSSLYLQMAELKLRKGDTAGATQIARKGLTYAETGGDLAADLQRFVQPE